MYMLCAKHGIVQSMDCAVQSMDPRFARAIHGLHYICAIPGLRKLHVRKLHVRKLHVRGQSFLMPRGICQLTTNDRSIMVSQAVFDDFITHNFVRKRGRMGTN